MAESMGANFPGYSIESGTVVRAVLVTLLVGLVAGISPAWVAGRLRPVEALGTGE
jgi:ABC-type antimicrobial peptide transport system permease subunit